MKKTSSLVSRLRARRRQRTGALSTVLTVLVLVICILLCVAGDRLEDRYALQQDFSFNGATTQSRVSAEQLAKVTRDVHVYLITSTGAPNQTVLSLLTRYAAQNSHISFSQENLSQNPLLATRFQDVLGENAISGDCIVVHCADTDRARILSEDDFTVYSYNIETGYYNADGFNYEKPLTEAIAFTAQDDPLTVQVLRGHGELSGDDYQLIEDLLTNANYAVRDLSLTAGDKPDATAPLLILCPQSDLSEQETQALVAFAEEGGQFLILSNYSDPATLTNFNALLRRYGIGLYSGLCMAKEENQQDYYDDKPAFLLPIMQQNELTQPLIDEGRTTLLMPGSRALSVSDDMSGLTVKPLLLSGDAYVRDYVHAAPDDVAQQDTDETGVFPLATLSTLLESSGQVSHAVVVGNSLMLTDYWIMNNTYSGEFFLRAVQYLQNDAPISLSIPAKQSVRQSLSLGSMMPAVLTLAVLILAIVFIALRVLLPRKHL
ncbi:MAG: GldG family protein [Clostridiales bacterium]|nr:GldG family protein [Clostridiales bacterium]